MKKNLLTQLSKTIMTALLFAFAFTSCENETVQPDGNSTDDFSKASARPNSLATVSLKVTVHSMDASGNTYNIQNDGKGDYLNGVDNVQAVLDAAGTFAFNTKSSTKIAAVRWVSYNFNNPVDPANAYRPSPSNSENYKFTTGGALYGTNPFIPLQNLGVNGNISSECIYMGNGIKNSATNWNVSFHRGNEDTANSPTAFAVVTRTKVKATDGVDEWTITPVGACSANSNVAALRSGDGITLYGYYNIPFFFTLRAL